MKNPAIYLLLTLSTTAATAFSQGSCCGTLPARFSTPAAPPSMVWIPGGTFQMGSTDPQAKPDEQPVHDVTLDGFWISRTPITNAEFKKFVDSTGYVTTAEKAPVLEDIMKELPPGTLPPPAEMLVPASLVFKKTSGPVPLNNPLIWWEWKHGADWRHPEGPDSSIEGKDDHPVVQVSWDDAAAYAKWAGMRLPTEAEWEYAARGGRDQQPYIWGDEPTGPQETKLNIWQGRFPYENTATDGFTTTSPVNTFSPNGYGLLDMAGNVWEWVADWYRPDTYARRAGEQPINNPKGPANSYDPQEPYTAKRVTRGGSFLCNDSYCSGYRPSARMKTSPDTSLIHTGFRCAMDPPTSP